MRRTSRGSVVVNHLVRVGPASWVIREIATGMVICETFSPLMVKLLNTGKYEAVPIGTYLAELHAAIKRSNPPQELET